MAASTPQRLRRVLISIAEDKAGKYTTDQRLDAAKQLLEMLKTKLGDRSNESRKRRAKAQSASILG